MTLRNAGRGYFMKITSLPEKERPLEKAAYAGIGTLSNAELLALIIHSGGKDRSALTIAEDILASCGDGLYDLGCMDFGELTKIRGLGIGKAGAVLAAAELGKRMSASRQPARKRAASSSDIAGLFMERLRYEKKEHFFSVLLNAKGEILCSDDISVGQLTNTIVHPREVFANAVRRRAASVIFVHNHPSGDPSPSDEDIQTTARLAEAGKILGIGVVDHVIIGDGKYTSLLKLGLL